MKLAFIKVHDLNRGIFRTLPNTRVFNKNYQQLSTAKSEDRRMSLKLRYQGQVSVIFNVWGKLSFLCYILNSNQLWLNIWRVLEEKYREGYSLSLKFRCSFMKLILVVCNQLKKFGRLSLINFVNLRFHETTSNRCRCEIRDVSIREKWNFLAWFLEFQCGSQCQ